MRGPEPLEELPPELAGVLRQTNGLVAFGGALHLRGVCDEPAWHSLHAAWRGPEAFAVRYRSVRPDDVPFAQDALGDQYLLRHGVVWRLSAEIDDAESLGVSLVEFLDRVSAGPLECLNLGPFAAFRRDGGRLAPGELLSVYPPLVVQTDDAMGGYSCRAVPAADRLRFLANLAAQIRDLPGGASIVLRVED